MNQITDPFVHYYAAASENEKTLARFAAVQTLIGRVMSESGHADAVLDVADIGCGAGTQCLMWARAGHRVHGLDINEALVRIARKRLGQASLRADLRVGTATALPWTDASMDVCLLPELLEHVAEWESCLDECGRILRPGGILYVSTTNVLCPVQQEFELPLYSWYPPPLKRYWLRRALSDRPEIVNHARFPAVNWFSFYSLRRALARRGFECRDRFQVMRGADRPSALSLLLKILANQPVLRWFAQCATPYSMVIATKSG